MKLLFFSRDYPTVFEWTNAVFNGRLCQALALRHELRVVAPVSWRDELLNRAAHSKIPKDRRRINQGVPIVLPRYYYTPRFFRQQYASFLWYSVRAHVRRLLDEFQPDAVIGYWSHPDGEVAMRIARMLGVPGIVMVGGSDVLVVAKEARRRKKVAAVLRSADAVVAVSEDLKQHVLALDVQAEKIAVVRRGVDVAHFTAGDKAGARKKLGIPPDRRVFLWVGRMVPVKAVDVLIAACKLLSDRRVDFHLCLVGRGALSSELASQVSRLGIGDRVTFAGPVEHQNLPDWFRAADLTVLPSLSEGVPNVLLESIACGTPFVASRVGGIREIADERFDRLVPPGDAEALAAAIEERLSAAAPTGSRQFLPKTWADSALEIEGLIEQLRHEAAQRETLGAVLTPPSQLQPNRVRQSVRRAMAAAIPRRWFMASGPAESGKVCLTFDDGPHPLHTPRVLDTLNLHNVRATFFLIGERAAAHPDLVRRIVGEGHTIGNHTYRHITPDRLSARELDSELRKTQTQLNGLTGRRVRFFRPPYGKLTIGKLARVWLSRQTVVLWNKDPKDYASGSAGEIEDWFYEHPVAGGDIVLLHDAFPHAADALPKVIAATRAHGLDFATVDEWVA